MTAQLPKERNLLLSDYLLLAVYFILSFIGILHHEMSETEMQNWVVASESSSVRELWFNMRYEPHPYLWHTMLFFISKIYCHYLSAQFFHIILTATAVFLIVKYSPFEKIYCWIFAFGYFPFYEYNLITRNYALFFLFGVLFLIHYKNRYKRYPVLFAICGLLANIHFYALVLSLIFTLLLSADYYQKKESLYRRQKTTFLLCTGCYLLVILGTIYYTRLPPDSILQVDVTSFSIGRAGQAFLGIWKSLVPIPRFDSAGFWNTNLLSSISPILFALISAVLQFVLVISFCRKPIAMALFFTASTCCVLLFYISNTTEMRHFGFFFFVFLASLWISAFYKESPFLTSHKTFNYIAQSTVRFRKPFLIFVLICHLISGAIFYVQDIAYPFSQAKNVVRYLNANNLSEEFIAVDRYHAIPSITGYLNKSVYSLATRGRECFLVWDISKKKILNNEELIIAIDHTPIHDKQLVLVLNYPLQLPGNFLFPQTKLKIAPLKKFTGSICPYENFYVYTLIK